jgi:hypothetical protein
VEQFGSNQKPKPVGSLKGYGLKTILSKKGIIKMQQVGNSNRYWNNL